MAKVTYRGVTYDTEHRPNQATKPAERQESYRGVKFVVDAEGHKRVLTAVWLDRKQIKGGEIMELITFIIFMVAISFIASFFGK